MIHTTREQWLAAFRDAVTPQFAALGAPLPPVRIALGWTGSGASTRYAGECWSDKVSADGTHEIYISPIIDDPFRAADILVHELCHAAAGLPAGHRGEFAKLARAFDLEGPLTATIGGRAFKRKMSDTMTALGPLPHARIMLDRFNMPTPVPTPGKPVSKAPPMSSRPKRQRGRNLKVSCADCGYTVRLTRKWLDVGAPLCPTHNKPMKEG